MGAEIKTDTSCSWALVRFCPNLILKQHQSTFPLRSPYRLEAELSITAVIRTTDPPVESHKANAEVPFTLLRVDEPLKQFWKHYFKKRYKRIFGVALKVGLGNISILYRYRDMRLDIVLDFGYRNIGIWHKLLSFPGFKGCVTVKWCTFLNLRDCFNCSIICLRLVIISTLLMIIY